MDWMTFRHLLTSRWHESGGDGIHADIVSCQFPGPRLSKGNHARLGGRNSSGRSCRRAPPRRSIENNASSAADICGTTARADKTPFRFTEITASKAWSVIVRHGAILPFDQLRVAGNARVIDQDIDSAHWRMIFADAIVYICALVSQ